MASWTVLAITGWLRGELVLVEPVAPHGWTKDSPELLAHLALLSLPYAHLPRGAFHLEVVT